MRLRTRGYRVRVVGCETSVAGTTPEVRKRCGVVPRKSTAVLFVPCPFGVRGRAGWTRRSGEGEGLHEGGVPWWRCILWGA